MQSSAVLRVKATHFREPKSAPSGRAHSAEFFQKNCRARHRELPAEQANQQVPARSAEIDSRTRMLLEQPIAPTILRLAIPMPPS